MRAETRMSRRIHFALTSIVFGVLRPTILTSFFSVHSLGQRRALVQTFAGRSISSTSCYSGTIRNCYS